MNRKRVLGIVLVLGILIGVPIGSVLSNGGNPTFDEVLGIFNVPWFNASIGVNAPAYYQNGIPLSAGGSSAETASYIIFKEGTTTYAKNGSTGQIDYSGTSATVIQSAIDNGDSLFIKSGTYWMATGATLQIDKRMSITGEGRFVTELRFDLSGAENAIEFKSTASDNDYVYLADFTINDGNHITTGAALFLERATYCVVERVTFWRFEAGYGVRLYGQDGGCYWNHFEDLTFDYVKYGVYLDGAGSLRCNANRFENIRVASDGVANAVGFTIATDKGLSNTLIGCDFSDVETGISINDESNFIYGQYLDTVTTGVSFPIEGNNNRVYGLHISGVVSTGINVSGNGNTFIGVYSTGVTTEVIDTGVKNRFIEHKNYLTENSGTTTLSNGQTSKTVSHGCDYTPSAGDFSVHPIEPLGSASYWYVDTITSSQFTIWVNVDPGQDVDFAWSVNRQ